MNLLGVHLGAEEDLMPPSEQNRLGYWENMSIYRINEQLLEHFGGSWYRPPALPTGWVDDQRLDALRGQAVRVVDELARPQRPWGFKDPRTIVLLPFWRQVIGEMDYVICVRRAQAVVQSVNRLDVPGAEPRATAKLWLDMNAAALVQTLGERRMFLFYEDWFDDARRVVLQLSAFIHGAGATSDEDAVTEVETVFDRELSRAHARAEFAGLATAPELDAMYAYLRLIALPTSRGRRARRLEGLVTRALPAVFRLRAALHDRLERRRLRYSAPHGAGAHRIRAGHWPLRRRFMR
jgi:hypothetical protein